MQDNHSIEESAFDLGDGDNTDALLDGVEMVENGIVSGQANAHFGDDAGDESDDSLDEGGLSRHSSILLKLHEQAIVASVETDD